MERYQVYLWLGLCSLTFSLNPKLALAVDEALSRPSEWASPLQAEGVHNFYKVSEHLYRSAQPDEVGYQAIAQLGVGTILNLRQYHLDHPPVEPEVQAIQFKHVSMNAGNFTEQQVLEALTVIAESPKPVLVHCLHGSDRTGTIVAMYRMVCQGWNKQQALDELMTGGYGYHRFFSNIPEFIESVDVSALRAQIHGVGCPAT
jgi:protein tyrosine/serine phosphatase